MIQRLSIRNIPLMKMKYENGLKELVTIEKEYILLSIDGNSF